MRANPTRGACYGLLGSTEPKVGAVVDVAMEIEGEAHGDHYCVLGEFVSCGIWFQAGLDYIIVLCEVQKEDLT